jgi:protein SCO1/2
MPRLRLAALLLVVTMGAGAACAPGAARPRPAAPAGAAPGSLFARPWVWSDEQGASVRFDRWRGAPIIVSMVFTTCTSVCPRTIEKLRRVDETLRRQGRAATFVLVTLDPANDTAAQLRRFKDSRQLPPGWHLLRGGDAETRELADLLRIHVLDDGHVFHDSRVVVFDAEGRLAGQLPG